MVWMVSDSAPEARATLEWLRQEHNSGQGARGHVGAGTEGAAGAQDGQDGPDGPDGQDAEGVAKRSAVHDGSTHELPHHAGAASENQRIVWNGVRWVQKNGAHWLTYQERSEPETRLETDQCAADESGGDSTILVLRPQRLTWIRRGSVQWRHEFESKQEFSSVMKLAGNSISVTTFTDALEVSVHDVGGVVKLRYSMDFSGEQQVFDMTIRFSKEG